MYKILIYCSFFFLNCAAAFGNGLSNLEDHLSSLGFKKTSPDVWRLGEDLAVWTAATGGSCHFIPGIALDMCGNHISVIHIDPNSRAAKAIGVVKIFDHEFQHHRFSRTPWGHARDKLHAALDFWDGMGDPWNRWPGAFTPRSAPQDVNLALRIYSELNVKHQPLILLDEMFAHGVSPAPGLEGMRPLAAEILADIKSDRFVNASARTTIDHFENLLRRGGIEQLRFYGGIDLTRRSTRRVYEIEPQIWNRSVRKAARILAREARMRGSKSSFVLFRKFLKP